MDAKGFGAGFVTAVAVAGAAIAARGGAQAGPPPPAPTPATAPAPPGTALLTVFLEHDQSRPLGELNEQLWRNGYYDRFPPEGIEVVSWYVVMGIGQVVTLRVPAERLREVNVALEETAWGAYRTRFFPTYDYRAIGEEQRRKMKARKR